jgi:hypothetical protein
MFCEDEAGVSIGTVSAKGGGAEAEDGRGRTPPRQPTPVSHVAARSGPAFD